MFPVTDRNNGKGKSLNEYSLQTRNDSGYLNNQRHIIILTLYRSGSTFFSELFNRNNDSMFIFEPLHSYKMLEDRNVFPKPSRLLFTQKLLKAIFECDFSNIPHGILLKDLCFHLGTYDYIRSLAPFCNYTANGIDSALMSSSCRKYRSVVAKTILIHDIADIKDVIINSNIKIIHLIRDPRGVMNSRVNDYRRIAMTSGLHTAKNVSLEEIKYVCFHMKRHIHYWLNTPNWLKGRLKLVKYEDMSEHPLEVAKDVYSFLQMTIPTSVVNWLQENTKGINSGITHRKSNVTAHAWRKELDREIIDTIQRECSSTMDVLGYDNV